VKDAVERTLVVSKNMSIIIVIVFSTIELKVRIENLLDINLSGKKTFSWRIDSNSFQVFLTKSQLKIDPQYYQSYQNCLLEYAVKPMYNDCPRDPKKMGW
jgi:hypothetical protein